MTGDYDLDSPLSEEAQDALINAELHVGGRAGPTSDEALAELVAAGYITGKHNLTKAGVREGIRVWEIYWDRKFNRATYKYL